MRLIDGSFLNCQAPLFEEIENLRIKFIKFLSKVTNFGFYCKRLIFS